MRVSIKTLRVALLTVASAAALTLWLATPSAGATPRDCDNTATAGPDVVVGTDGDDVLCGGVAPHEVVDRVGDAFLRQLLVDDLELPIARHHILVVVDTGAVQGMNHHQVGIP